MELTYVRYTTLKKRKDDFIQMDRQLIRMLGYESTAFITEVDSWSDHNQGKRKTLTHFRDGKWWMYRTIKEWSDELSISVSKAERVISKLRSFKIINVQRLDEKKNNQTNWYSVNEDMLDLMMCFWFANNYPRNGEEKYADFSIEYSRIANQIDIGFIKAQDELKRIELIIFEAQNGSNKNLPLPQNEVVNDSNGSENPFPQNEGMDSLKMNESLTDTTIYNNNLPETKNFDFNSEDEIEKYSELFVKPANVVSENEFLDFSLVKWIRQKNGSGKTSMRRYEKSLGESRKYDDSKEISALELYESDNVFRTWCEERYSELHKDGYGDKPLGVENTVKMVIDEPCFFAWQEKKRGVVEAMDEVQYDDDLSEYDKMQDKGLDMFEDDDD